MGGAGPVSAQGTWASASARRALRSGTPEAARPGVPKGLLWVDLSPELHTRCRGLGHSPPHTGPGSPPPAPRDTLGPGVGGGAGGAGTGCGPSTTGTSASWGAPLRPGTQRRARAAGPGGEGRCVCLHLPSACTQQVPHKCRVGMNLGLLSFHLFPRVKTADPVFPPHPAGCAWT